MDRKTTLWLIGLRIACVVLLFIVWRQSVQIGALTHQVYRQRGELVTCQAEIRKYEAAIDQARQQAQIGNRMRAAELLFQMLGF